VDNKARDVELMLARYPNPTHDDLVRAVDEAGLKLYCCRRYILTPEIVYYEMENRPVIEGVRPVSEAVAVEARNRLEGDFMFGLCSSATEEAPSSLTGSAKVEVAPAPVLEPRMTMIIPQPYLSQASRTTQRTVMPPIPAPQQRSSNPVSTAPASLLPLIPPLQTLQAGINQERAIVPNQQQFIPLAEPEPEPAKEEEFKLPTALGIPTYNPPLEHEPVMVAVGARHHTEVISGVTFLAI